MKWIELPSEWIQTLDGVRKVKIAGRHICLIRYEDRIYATSARCPHAGADLSGGWCENGRLICPYHRHAFDLENGKGDPGQGNYITTYPIRQQDGQSFIGIKESWFKKWF